MTAAVQAFGGHAAQWGNRLPAGTQAILTDGSDAARALEAAAALRLTGTAYVTGILLDDRKAVIGSLIAASILGQLSDIDDRQAAFDKLAAEQLTINGTQQHQLTCLTPEVTKTLEHLWNLSDCIVARSWTEYNRLAALFGGYRHNVKILAPADPSVPPPARVAARDAIVIWAPHLPSVQCALLAFSLEEFHAPLIVVSADGASQPLRASFVTPDGAADALARALIIVDSTLGDPATAVALHAHGVPLAVSATSGAHETLDSLYLYDPSNWRSIARAAYGALGGTRAILRGVQTPSEPASTPLVSLVTPTYNRRDRLPATLERWARQQYPNFELVLVNDGGEPIEDLVAAYPFVRLINLEKNSGIPRALNIGVDRARGEYLLLCADDDQFAADHISNLVAALERTGGSVAHSNTVIRHEEVIAGGGHRITGYSLDWRNTMDMSRVLYTACVAVTGMLIRRSAFIDIGTYSEELETFRDYDMILSLALKHDFIHVDKTTAVYSSRSDPSSFGYSTRAKLAPALRAIFAKHPSERATIVSGRAFEIGHYEKLEKGGSFYEPPIRLDP